MNMKTTELQAVTRSMRDAFKLFLFERGLVTKRTSKLAFEKIDKLCEKVEVEFKESVKNVVLTTDFSKDIETDSTASIMIN